MEKTFFTFVEFQKRKLLTGCCLAALALLSNAASGGSMKFGVVIAALFLLLSPLRLQLQGAAKTVVFVLWGLCVSAAAAVLQQLASGGFEFFPAVYLFEALVFWVVCLLVYALFPHWPGSVLIGLGLFLLLPLAGTYVYLWRGTALMPWDLLSLKTAVNVSAAYSIFPMPPNVSYVVSLYGALVFSLWVLPEVKRARGMKRRMAAVLAAVALSVVVLVGRPEVQHGWQNSSAGENGAHLSFLDLIIDARRSPPEGYDPTALESLARPAEGTAEKHPTILVIMDEAFADLSVFGEPLRTNEEILPFISGLRETENTISGYALASVFGGTTANSEWEFLTGASMAWMPKGSIPYQQYVEDGDYSVLTDLKQLGYRCVSMHPYLADGWQRPAVYESYGFDETYFLDDFPQEDLVRDLVSDREMFAEIIQLYEERGEEPLFCFGITMQNHGAYNYTGENYEKTVSLEGYSQDYPQAEQYLSLLRHTDRAVEELLDYFSKQEDPVVVVFFGDHLPRLEDAFFEELNGGPLDNPKGQAQQHSVPFFVWANYDIPEQSVDCSSSISYLPSYMMEAAGLPLSPWMNYLSQLRREIPAINAELYYSRERVAFLPLEEATGREREALKTYEALQYNSLFDETERNAVFFPRSEK